MSEEHNTLAPTEDNKPVEIDYDSLIAAFVKALPAHLTIAETGLTLGIMDGRSGVTFKTHLSLEHLPDGFSPDQIARVMIGKLLNSADEHWKKTQETLKKAQAGEGGTLLQ